MLFSSILLILNFGHKVTILSDTSNTNCLLYSYFKFQVQQKAAVGARAGQVRHKDNLTVDKDSRFESRREDTFVVGERAEVRRDVGGWRWAAAATAGGGRCRRWRTAEGAHDTDHSHAQKVSIG